MAEPLVYQVLQKVQALLVAIVADGGAAYWYTPAVVLIVPPGEPPWSDARLWDESVAGAIYGVCRTSSMHSRRNTGDNTNGPRDMATLTIEVLVAQRFVASSPTDTPDLALITERMLRDVLRKLAFEGPGLGVAIDADDVLASETALVINAPPGWAAGVAQFQVVYDYFSSAP
jgi:hypothetical protein